MSRTDPTPDELLRAALDRDGGRPLLTWYDEDSGERVELSVATFENWVAKTAGLLQDGLAAGPGQRVALLLPPHWQSLVWAAACWTAGCTVTLAAEPAQVAVCGPATLQEAAATGAAELVAMSLRPLGLPFAGRLPDRMLDYAVEVPAYPDHFTSWSETGPADPAVAVGGTVHTRGGLVRLARDRAGQLGLGPGARILRAADRLDLALLLDALLVPLALEGSCVLVRGGTPERLGRIAATERVTAPLPG